MTLRDYIMVIRRKWPVMLVCAAAAALAVWILTPAKLPPPTPESYSATATMLVESSGDNGSGGGFGSLSRISLYIRSGEVPAKVAERMGAPGSGPTLANSIKVTEDQGAQAIELTAESPDGAWAAALANAFATESVEFFKSPRAGTGNVSLSVLQEAVPVVKQGGAAYVIPPSRTMRTLLGGLAGLVVGFVLGLVLHQFDSRLRSRDEVHDAMQMPIVAEVPRLSRSHSGSIAFTDDPLNPYADAYRVARAALTHSLAADVGTPVILVTSAHAGEGKTTSAANLAASFVELDKRVLVLDADLRSPDAHRIFDVPQGAGISDYLVDPSSTAPESLIRPTNTPGVGIMTAGTSLANPTALSNRIGMLIAEARDLADVVIVDSAPLLDASDVFDILPMVDSVLLAVRSGKVTDAAARRAAELLRRFRIPVAGVMLIGVPPKRAQGYGYGYGYGSGYGNDKKAKRGRRADAGRARAGSTRQRNSASR